MESNKIQAALAMPADAKDEPAVQPASPEYRRKAGAAAEQFEAQFVREMFKQIRKKPRARSPAKTASSPTPSTAT
ncbi:hypothetical protein JOS77_24160 [Chromobacterium haemolyticum]|nr:hypothetical protein JOS77_24160 [Chromobacterium haemolyticum]